LEPVVPELRKLAAGPEIAALFDEIEVASLQNAQELMTAVKGDLVRAGENWSLRGVKAPKSLVVMVNPLDSYGAMREGKTSRRDGLIVGPDQARAREVVLAAVLQPIVAEAVHANWGRGKLVRAHWEGVKLSKKVTERYADGPAYMIETLARSLAYYVRN